MGVAVVDSSVLIAFLDAQDTNHRAATRALREERNSHALVVPAVAYAEVLVGAHRGGDEAVAVAERFFDASTRVEPMTPAMARLGAELRAGHRLRLPDALILATGLELDADVILTADRIWRRIDARVRVIGRGRPRRG